MKTISKTRTLLYFINTMDFNIDDEIDQVMAIISNNTFDRSLLNIKMYYYLTIKQNYLFNVMVLTMQYSNIEIYLKKLLTKISVDDFVITNGNVNFKKNSLLRCMMINAKRISLNTFEMIINYGVNINHIDCDGSGAIYILLAHNNWNSHVNNVLNLFIKHDANLNIISNNGCTALDLITYFNFSKQDKICAMILLDNGAKTNEPNKNSVASLFIESYRCSSIKPAIKNEK